MRFSAFFIGVCITIVAGSAGAVAYLAFDRSLPESAAAAAGVFILLFALNAFSGRSQKRAAVSDQIADLSRGTADLARQVGDLGRRVVTFETTLTQMNERTRIVTDPLAAEIDILGTLVKQLAESVAAHETALLSGTGSGTGTNVPRAVATYERAQRAPTASEAPAPPRLSDDDDTQRPAPNANEMTAVVRAALESSRVDLHLQPIVTVPQRKVRFYEVLTRLRTADGSLLMPAEFLKPAEAAGLMPLLDNLMLLRSIQIVRRLTTKNRESGLFCNIAGQTLVDTQFFPQVLEFMTANRALASALVFEFSQRAVRAMGPVEHENLAQLAGLGFRFSMDHVGDLLIEPRHLSEQGFRFVKLPASLLLSRASAGSDIHPSDFADLFRRHGIDLIAEKIESEGMVVDLLDFDIRFGQGFLFSPPRPLRNEVFQGGSERASVEPAGEAAPAARVTEAGPIERRRDGDPPIRPAPAEGASPGLMKLARTVMRRA